MAHTLGLRATSFAASAALLGVAVFAALSVTMTLQSFPLIDPPAAPIVTLRPPDPPPPQPERIVERQPASPTEDQVFFDAPFELPPIHQEEALAGAYAPAGPPEITNPRWLRRPRDLGVYYPTRALARGVTGEVLLDCLVSVSGTLNCDVVAETPPSWGFADAARRISRDHRMAPAMRDGVAVPGRYRMRVPFQVR